MDFAQLIIIAILIEAIWENLKMVYDKEKINVNMIGSLILAMLVCVLARINIFEIVGISLIFPVVGYVLTGVICSRGANFINDLLKKVKGE